jgi:peroxiredoxin
VTSPSVDNRVFRPHHRPRGSEISLILPYVFVKPYLAIIAVIAVGIVVAIPLEPRLASHWERWRMEHQSISQPTPELSLPDIFDHMVNLSDDKGKVVLLYLWATWCPPCRAETPALIELQRRYETQGFTVIACSRDQDPELVRQFYRRYHLNYPVVMAAPPVQKFFGTALGIQDEQVLTEVPIPTAILIGREGQIDSVYVGRDLAALNPALNQLLAQKSVAVGKS